MNDRPDGSDTPGKRCYTSGASQALRLAGFALIAVGAVLLLCSISDWVWLTFAGLVLIAAGFVLTR